MHIGTTRAAGYQAADAPALSDPEIIRSVPPPSRELLQLAKLLHGQEVEKED